MTDPVSHDERRSPSELFDWFGRTLPALGVAVVTLERVGKMGAFKGGSVSDAVQDVTQRARSKHEAYGFGFWEFALSETGRVSPEVRRALVSNALRHSPLQESSFQELPTPLFLDEGGAGAYEELPDGLIVSLLSQVRLVGGEVAHIPMLDFSVRSGASGLEVAAEAIHALGLKGTLFGSGRSYHFYGADVVNESTYRTLLARAQLLSPIVDARWISHQLIDGMFRLRVSTAKTAQRHVLALEM